MEKQDRKELFDQFCNIIAKLRAPDGCPWDRKQTAESLKKSLLEECGEALEAIDKKDDENLCEELGDVLLVVGMIARIKEEEGKFDISDVLSGVNDKLIRRHPHVFGDAKASSPEEVLKLWNQVKEEEKKKKASLQ
ncbi:MAG: MazG family protein [Spirochaetia bacterium]|nr:MazG family protein [Spirochaetia bacterium]